MNPFHFKYFSIQQTHSALKVGTDAMLLGSLCNWTNPKRLLDIGTGTGVLSLMCAQRFPFQEITAIDIENTAITDATVNAQNNPFTSPIRVFEQDVLHFEPQKNFDAIVCNPPFFENSLKNPDSQKATARHTESLPFTSLFSKISQLLTQDGQAWIILPIAALETCEPIWSSCGLKIRELIYIQGKPNSTVRFVTCLSKTATVLIEQTFLIRDEHGQYTSEYKKITADFHDRSV